MNRKLFYTIVCAGIFFTVSCKEEDKDIISISDSQLILKMQEPGYVYYTQDTLPANGPHQSFVLVRFNSKASSVLNQNNEIEPGQTFPEGSVIVKEVFDTIGGLLRESTIMLKSKNDKNASGNWVWAMINADNSIAVSVTQKGQGCVECHSATPNRDGVKIFDAH